MPSFKIKSSGYWSKKNLDSIRKVNIRTGKSSWQKTLRGLPQTGRIIQAMAKMDSISTEAMRLPKRFQRESSTGEAKTQNSIFGADCNRIIAVHVSQHPFPSQKLKHCGEVMIFYPFLFSPQLRTQSTFCSVLSFATKDLKYTDLLRLREKHITWIIIFP